MAHYQDFMVCPLLLEVALLQCALRSIINNYYFVVVMQVEFCYPKLKYGEVDGRPVMPPEWGYITALALPDGAHLTKEGGWMVVHVIG